MQFSPPSTLNFMSSCSGEVHKLHTKSFLTVADSVAPGRCTLIYLNPNKKHSISSSYFVINFQHKSSYLKPPTDFECSLICVKYKL